MPRVVVLRIPEVLQDRIEMEAHSSQSSVEGFLIFCAVFYLETKGGDIVSYGNDKICDFIRLAATGMSLRRIESDIGVSHGTAVAWNRKYGGRIIEMSKADVDEVLEEWKESRTHRIAKLARTVKVLEENIAERDLSEIPTKVLLKMNLAYRRELRSQIDPQAVNVRVSAGVEAYQRIVDRCLRLEPDHS